MFLTTANKVHPILLSYLRDKSFSHLLFQLSYEDTNGSLCYDLLIM